MTTETFKVGGEVDSKCGKCKVVTSHVIVAMLEEKPKRVECLACHALHNYRPPTPVKAPRAKSGKATKRGRAGAVLEISEENAVDYTPKGKFTMEQTLRHKKFGFGLITKVEPTRITVIFPDKETRMFILTL